MSAHVRFFFLFFLLSIAPATAQQSETLRDGEILDTTTPDRLFDEWRIGLRSGGNFRVDRGTISIRDNALHVDGNLRSMTIPTNTIRSITIAGSPTPFRDLFLPSFFIASMFSFSPQGVSGYYVGTQKRYEYAYYGQQTSETYSVPGVSLWSALIAAGSAMATGFIGEKNATEPVAVNFDGTESDAAWRALLAMPSARWRFHGSASYVSSASLSDWKKGNESNGIVDMVIQNSNYYTVPRPDVSRINLGRLVRFGYMLDRSWEVGIGFQSDGVQRFYQGFKYARPGTPPAMMIREVSHSATTQSLFATGQYELASVPTLRTRIALGAGFGPSFVNVDLFGYDYRQTQQSAVKKTQLLYAIFASAEYVIDPRLSVGLTIDYSNQGSITIPRTELYDSDMRVLAIFKPIEISTASLGIGVSFTSSL